ncbi:MAG: hypothetical protein CVU65_02300 [Deltaproteobacteria bacterium HGW-Deltaproteobacteria-22]|nr:MAG: hypothetical protein CVU65_02300 [Deltaproteobacteria bacterium HGW-Deltaproteobacteria-22]
MGQVLDFPGDQVNTVGFICYQRRSRSFTFKIEQTVNGYPLMGHVDGGDVHFTMMFPTEI